MFLPGGIIGGLKQEIIFKGTLSGAAATSHTFNNVDFGSPKTSRLVVVGYFRVNSGATVTIDGGGTQYGASGDLVRFVVGQPTGATGTIVMTHATTFRAVAAVWVIYGMNATPVANDYSQDVAAPITNDASVALEARGAWLGMSYSGTGTHSLSGIGNTGNATLNSVDYIAYGHDLTAAAGTGTIDTTVENRIAAISFGAYP